MRPVSTQASTASIVTKNSMSVRNSAPYSARALAASRSYWRSTNFCVSVPFIVRDGAFATRISGSPPGPKSRLTVFHNSPLRAYGLDMHASKPPVVARHGRKAERTSKSGLLVVSERHTDTSSQMAAHAVPPLMLRNDAGRQTSRLSIRVAAVARTR